jgi:hypothetical protein
MAKGISLHIGLNRVDPDKYEGWDGTLQACENDARDMKKLAEALGYEGQIMLTDKATSQAVSGAIRDAASKLGAGDVLLLTYSGHGGQVPDTNNDERDRYDETWVLFDRQLVDDELYALWAGFPAGSRIIVLSDSCHSGTVTRRPPWEAAPAAGVPRQMPREVEDRTYQAHKAEYDAIQAGVKGSENETIGTAVALISGCQDDQFSMDGQVNGLFTEKLLATWDDGSFRGTLRVLRDGINALMPKDQTPKYYTVGAGDTAISSGQALAISTEATVAS